MTLHIKLQKPNYKCITWTAKWQRWFICGIDLNKVHVIHTVELISWQNQNVFYSFVLVIILKKYAQHQMHWFRNPNKYRQQVPSATRHIYYLKYPDKFSNSICCALEPTSSLPRHLRCSQHLFNGKVISVMLYSDKEIWWKLWKEYVLQALD